MRQSCFKSMQRLLQFPRSLASSPPSVFHFIKCSWAHASWALSRESDSWLRENAFHCPFQKKKTNFITISWSGQHFTTIYSSDAPITILSHGGTKQGITGILNQLFDASFHFYNKCFRTELTLFLEAMTLDSRHIPTNGFFKAMHCAQSCKNPQPLRTCCFAR